jgi:hypothetical protein
MPRPTFPPEQIAELSNSVAAYIAEQRGHFAANARPVTPEHKRLLGPFFPADILDQLRVIRGRASEPSFYPKLKAIGISNAPRFSQMAGITFQDVVVHVEPLTEALLFHELVHAVQYKHLGLKGFAEHYVRGFLSGGSYEEIPLEKQAYELEARFAEDRDTRFSVEADVKERTLTNRF